MCVIGVYNVGMKSMTVRLPDRVITEIEEEAQKRGVSKSDIIRERVEQKAPQKTDPIADIRHLIGAIKDDTLPPDLSASTKHYLRARGAWPKAFSLIQVSSSRSSDSARF
jgi:Arc/MetJ-type ribon-helix-helix transcriptional regulator